MYCYSIGERLLPCKGLPGPDEPAVVLLTSEELSQGPQLAGLEEVLCHAPAARDARVCKAEVRSGCLSGTLCLPKAARDGSRLACGYLITPRRVVLVADNEALLSHVKHLSRERRWPQGSVGRFFYDLLELLIAKDLHHLEEAEDRAEALEEQVLAGRLDGFSAAITPLRKEAMGRFRYYSQLGDVACELQENENGFFSPGEQRLFRMLQERVTRLREEAQLLREYCAQVQSMFQAEISIRQNRTMQILTIVTTIFLPLTLLTGWYGMNFAGMPELTWRYGYPAVIAASLAIIAVSLWICRKKRFW